MDNYVLLNSSEAQTLLTFFKGTYILDVEKLNLLGLGNSSTQIEGFEPKESFIKNLRIIIRLIKIIVASQGYIPGTPKFDDHVLQNFNKNFPDWTKYLQEYDIN